MYIMQSWAKSYIEQKSNSKYDIFAKFIIVWISFNGYTKEKYKTKNGKYKNDRNQLNDFINENSKAKNSYTNLIEDRSGNLFSFFDYVQNKPYHKCGIYNYRNDQLVPYDDFSSFEQYINAIYQIRCNLVHCSKDLTNEHDKLLVQIALDSFKSFLEKLED